jgi:hypothetical protein
MDATALFPSGRLMMTRGIAAAIADQPAAAAAVKDALRRHLEGDCGDMEHDDVLANASALLTGERIFSSYLTPIGKLWVITEADRSATTVLFPAEY